MDHTQAYDLANIARRSEAPVSPKAAGAVEILVADITDRRGLKWEWEKIDEDVRARIMEVWGRIIDLATARPPADVRKSAVQYGCSQCGNLSFEMYTAHAADRNYHAEQFDLFVE